MPSFDDKECPEFVRNKTGVENGGFAKNMIAATYIQMKYLAMELGLGVQVRIIRRVASGEEKYSDYRFTKVEGNIVHGEIVKGSRKTGIAKYKDLKEMQRSWIWTNDEGITKLDELLKAVMACA